MRQSVAALTLSLGLLFTGLRAEAQVPVLRPGLSPSVFERSWAPSIGLRLPSTAVVAPAPQPARPGLLRCAAEENGIYAPSSVVVQRAGIVVARGSCASALELAPGSYVAIVTLESALDRPTRAVPVQIVEGAEAVARATFATSILEVRFSAAGQAVPGLAIIRRNGVQIGTLGSGVVARLSAGTYEIVARYRTEERIYTVVLAPAQRRALQAGF